jgi:hypothetical protein
VCPDACVEFWEYCPSGTGELASVVQSKSIDDVINQMINGPSGGTGVHVKDYRECYAFGTYFCTLPESKLTPDPTGMYVCTKDCPAGTYQQGDTCYANAQQDASSGTLYCNPQYFSSVTVSGITIGCKKLNLPAQTTQTCPIGHETIVNDQFTVEWCLPKCNQGFWPTPNLDGCFASCQDASSAGITTFFDYVSYFLPLSNTPSGRCATGTTCPQDWAGKCPTDSAIANVSSFTRGVSVPVPGPTGMNTTYWSVESLPKKTRPGLTFGTPLATALQTSQKQTLEDPNSITQCPQGMISNLPGTGEQVGFCYDECPPKFNSAELCITNNEISLSDVPNCDPTNVRYVCIADCPGGYSDVTINAKGQKMLTCAYNYPNNIVPFDPNLFVQCPVDGTMIQVDLTDTTTPNGNNVNPRPPVCIRKIFQRNESCPLNYIYVPPDFKTTPTTAARCIQNCPANSVPVWQNNAVTCMTTCPQDGRFAQDYHSTYTSGNILPEFRDANCIRKSFAPGGGSDPNALATPPNTNSDARNIGLVILAIFIGFLVLSKFKFF